VDDVAVATVRISAVARTVQARDEEAITDAYIALATPEYRSECLALLNHSYIAIGRTVSMKTA
jgi:hypothetical protein